MGISLRVLLWLIGLALISPSRVQAQTTLLRVGTNSPSSAESVLFSIARDTGILKQHQLDVEVIFIAGGTLSMQALVSRSLEFLCTGGTPYIIADLEGAQTKWKQSWLSPQEFFEDYRFFVACEAEEDIPYLIQYTGKGHLLTGSDYGHNDPGEQAHLVAKIKAREDLSPTLVEKILCDNPQQFYNVYF